jgi:hypothetical protein
MSQMIRDAEAEKWHEDPEPARGAEADADEEGDDSLHARSPLIL